MKKYRVVIATNLGAINLFLNAENKQDAKQQIENYIKKTFGHRMIFGHYIEEV